MLRLPSNRKVTTNSELLSILSLDLPGSLLNDPYWSLPQCNRFCPRPRLTRAAPAHQPTPATSTFLAWHSSNTLLRTSIIALSMTLGGHWTTVGPTIPVQWIATLFFFAACSGGNPLDQNHLSIILDICLYYNLFLYAALLPPKLILGLHCPWHSACCFILWLCPFLDTLHLESDSSNPLAVSLLTWPHTLVWSKAFSCYSSCPFLDTVYLASGFSLWLLLSTWPHTLVWSKAFFLLIDL